MTNDGVSSDEVRGQALAVAWCVIGCAVLLTVGFIVGAMT